MDFERPVRESAAQAQTEPTWADELVPMATEMAKTAGLFLRGKAGLGLTLASYAYAETLHSKDDLALEALRGAGKGALMKASFAFLEPVQSIAGKGVLLGVANRLIDSSLSGSTYKYEGLPLAKVLNDTFDPLAMSSDAAVFVAGHGMFKGLQKVNKGLSERPILTTVLTGGTFGMASGSASEILRQQQSNENVDLGKVVGQGLKHAVMDSVAALPAGIQADKIASKQLTDLSKKATKEINRQGRQVVREVRWRYWQDIAKIQPKELGLLIPEEITQSKDWLAAMEAVNILNKAGYEAYFVGGCVRDLLLGKTPKDIDIVTNAPAQRVDELMPKGEIAGKNFAVKHTEINGVKLEVATFRCDGAYSDGRRPDEVVALDHLPVHIAMREDAGRRDFRFNSMFLDPKTSIAYYYFDGPADLMNKRIDTVGSPRDRFNEDPSRMLRVARFASKLGFEPTEKVVIAMIRDAHKIHRSANRTWGMEFGKLLMTPDPVKGLTLIKDTGLMKEMVPELTRLDSKDGNQDPIHHPEGNTWVHTMMVINRLVQSPKRNMDLMFSGLFHDIGKPDTQKITDDGRITNHKHEKVGADLTRTIARERFDMSNDQTKSIADTVARHMAMHGGPQMKSSTLKSYLELPIIENLIELQEADALGRGTCCATEGEGNKGSQREFWEAALKEARFPAEPTRAIDAEPILDGKELIALGYKSGIPLGEIAKAAAFAQYEGKFTDMAGAVKWLQENCESPAEANERTTRINRERRENKARERKEQSDLARRSKKSDTQSDQ